MEKPWYPCTHNDKVTLLDHMNHIADKHRSGTFFTNVAFLLFTPRSNKQFIYSHNIAAKSNIKVVRIKEMITNERSSQMLNKFSWPIP